LASVRSLWEKTHIASLSEPSQSVSRERLRHLLISNDSALSVRHSGYRILSDSDFHRGHGTILASDRKGHSQEQFQERVGGCALQPFVYFSGPPYKVTHLGAKMPSGPSAIGLP
jgi:hypothetical protein